MSKWIFILRLFGADHETGELEWHEAVRMENLPFSICIENVVDTTNILSDARVRHEVYCKEMPKEENEDK